MVGIKKIALFLAFIMSISIVFTSFSSIQEKKELQQHPMLFKRVMHSISIVLVTAIVVYFITKDMRGTIVKIKSLLRSIQKPKFPRKTPLRDFDKKEHQQIVQDICRMYPLPIIVSPSISPKKVGALLQCYYHAIAQQYGKKGARQVFKAQAEHLDLQFQKTDFTNEDILVVADFILDAIG